MCVKEKLISLDVLSPGRGNYSVASDWVGGEGKNLARFSLQRQLIRLTIEKASNLVQNV